MVGGDLRRQPAGAADAAAPLLVEQVDAPLAQALARLAVHPSAATHTAVGQSYIRLHILDRAFTHFSTAIRMDIATPAAHEGVARIWRDWGFPHLGLADAYRAVHYGPRSASARNTLGTVLQALGQQQAALASFEHAVRLDGSAAYVFNNLCYSALQAERRAQAADWCRRAIRLDPTLASARNNMALVLGATATRDELRQALGADGPTADLELAVGLAFLANARYEEAVAAFDSASRLSPALRTRAAWGKAHAQAALSYGR